MKIDNTLPVQGNSSVATSKADEAKAGQFENILKKAAENGDKAGLKKACQDMESLFVQMIFKQMRSSEDSEGGLFEKSQAQGIFEGMMDEELSKKISSGGGLGLSDMLYKQMEKYLPENSTEKTTSKIDSKG